MNLFLIPSSLCGNFKAADLFSVGHCSQRSVLQNLRRCLREKESLRPTRARAARMTAQWQPALHGPTRAQTCAKMSFRAASQMATTAGLRILRSTEMAKNCCRTLGARPTTRT